LLSGLDDMVTATSQALDSPHETAQERVRTLLTTLAGLAVERREVTALWRWEGPNLGPAGAAQIRERSTGLLESWTRTLRTARPELEQSDAELLCWAALSVLGSVAVHRTSIAKRRFEQLLALLAGRALHANLPERSRATSGDSAARRRIGTPSRREQVLTAANEMCSDYGSLPGSM